MIKDESDLSKNFSKEEMEGMIAKMRAANSIFYRLAQSTGVHTFIEFCGLQAKYIDLCQTWFESGIEFPCVNVHNDTPAPVDLHHLDYLGEKFECIYGPAFFGNPQAVRFFIQRVFGAEYLKVEEADVERD